MTKQNTPAAMERGEGEGVDKAEAPRITSQTQSSKWREKYKVHPAATTIRQWLKTRRDLKWIRRWKALSPAISEGMDLVLSINPKLTEKQAFDLVAPIVKGAWRKRGRGQ